MASKNVKVPIPIRKILEFLQLLETLYAKHVSLGDDSPIDNVDMTKLKENVDEVIDLRTSSRSLRAQSESKMEDANLIVGVEPGQNSKTPGTLYYDVAKIRNLLLVEYEGHEERLSDWGFKVVVSQPTYRHKEEEPTK